MLGDSTRCVQWLPTSCPAHQARPAHGPSACLPPQRVLFQETLWRERDSAKTGSTQEDGMNGGVQVVHSFTWPRAEDQAVPPTMTCILEVEGGDEKS